MKIHPLVDALFLEWRYRVHNGTPDPTDAGHVSILREICLQRGIQKEAVDAVILALEKDESWWEKMTPDQQAQYIKAVSYTHLTLPTKA